MYADSPVIVWPRMWNQSTIFPHVLDASGEKLGFVYQVWKTGNLEKVRFRTGAVTTSETIKVSAQDVDLANGEPDEVEDQSGTQTSPTASTWHEVTLGSVRAVTAGDLVAIVFEFDSTVGNLEIWSLSAQEANNVYPTHKTGGTWAHKTDAPLMILTYDDGNVYFTPGILPGFPGTSTYNNTDTPDEIALQFTLPWPAKCSGAIIKLDLDGDCDIVLYEGTTALATATLDTNVRAGDFSEEFFVTFSSTIELSAGVTYYLSAKPTSASDISLRQLNTNGADGYDMLEGGSAIFSASRTDAGAWSPSTTQRPNIALFLSSIGAMQVHPGMTGGMNG